MLIFYVEINYQTMNINYKIKSRFLAQYVIAFVLMLVVFTVTGYAQVSNVPVTGFNSDQVAEGIGAPTTTSTAGADGGVDNGGYVFIDGTYQYNGTCALATTNILPANNLIPSTAVPGLNYVLQPYNQNNALRVPATGVLAGNGKLFLNTPTAAGAIYLLSVSGGGAITSGVTVTIKFTDSTSQVFSNQTATDWCNTTSSGNYTKITTTNYNRIQAPTTTGCGNFATCQYFAEMALVIDPTNHAKQIAYISIDKTTSTNVMNVYAVGMVPGCVAPTAQPTVLASSVLSTGYITAGFTAASPAPSGYLVVRYPQNATPTAPNNGTTYSAGQALGSGTVVQASSAITFTANGLTPSTTYDFYVYAYYGPCSPTASNPIYLTASPLTASFTTSACGGTLSGNIAVGPSGTYTNITNALTAIGTSGLSGAVVLELGASYDPSTETFPITFQGNPCASSALSITIRPASSVISPIVITSNNATATFDFNGGRFITLDGRAGGSGSGKLLSIVNTSSTGVALRFINDASNNNILYCDVQGQNTSATTSAASAQVGVISFGTANAVTLNGNDSNLISNCDIHATSTGFPAIAIASFGNSAATPVSAWNNNNSISNCNIYDFFSASLASTAIKLDGGSHAFTINNNRVYQTATRTYTTTNQHRAFWISPSATGACGFQILNNIIGGADALGTGVWTLAGAVGTNFWGMDINHSGVIPTSVQGNTITSLSLTSTTTTANDLFRGISTGNVGHVYIGNIVGNTIGSATQNGAITLVTSGTGSTSYGIKCASTSASTDTVRIQNNTVGGIQVSSSTATSGTNIHGIGVTSASYVYIENNIVGSLFNPDGIFASNNATSVQSVHGISVASGIYSTVVNNTIANLTNNYTGTSTGYTRGIYLTSSTTSVVSGNLVKNISSKSAYTGTGTASALIGIQVSSSNPSTIVGNTIDSLVLANTSSTSAIIAEGIYAGLNGATPTHLIAKNKVAHFMVANTANNNAILSGINITGGSNIVANNMVQLGLNTDGNNIDLAVVMRGIYLNTTTATNVYHNSVYIGGTNVGTAAKNTQAFWRNASSGTHDVRNNIFVNQRSNATTGGKHYQLFLNTTNGLSLSNNVYYGTGNGSIMGTSNNGTNDVVTFTSGWLTTDTASTSSDPKFMAPDGGNALSTTPLDLHINPTLQTAVEGAGRLVAISDDIDGDIRNNNTPVDIGADAGLYTPMGMSIDSTVVTQVTAGSPIGAVNQAVIAIKVYAKGNVSPLTLTALKLNTSGTTNALTDLSNAKIYYTGPSNTFNTGTQYGSTVTSPNGTFYANGAQVLTSGLNCFWVAYDIQSTATANNFIDARLDSVGLTGATPANILNGDPAGNRKLSAPLAGTYNIGTSQTYPTITAALTDLNLLGVSGAVIFELTDATYSTNETFPIVINAIQGASATNTITIRPATGVTSVVTANIANSLVRLDGVRFFVFDGRQGGAGTTRSLSFVNDNTAGSALTFINDASNNTLRYVTMRGASTNTVIGVVNFATGIVTGNDNNTIEYSGIGDAATLPTTLIQARGSIDATAKFNTGNVISNCDLFNFWHASGESNAMKISKGNAGWTISGNSVYQTASRTFSNIHYTFNWNRVVDDATNSNDAMAAASLVNMLVEDNYFGGSAPLCGGTPWTETTSGGAFCSYFNMGDSALSFVRRNTFANFNITNTNTGTGVPGSWNAIQFIGGKLHIDSNLIGSVTDTNSIYISGANGNIVYPIACTGGTAGNYRINGNTFGGIRVSGNGSTAFNVYPIFLSGASTTVTYDIDNNNIGVLPVKILSTTSTTAQLIAGINTTSGANLNIRNNIIHNLYNDQFTTGTGQTIGIRSTGGINSITGNVIDSLFNNTMQVSANASAAIIGISLTSTGGSALVERNVIQELVLQNSLTASVATGIYYAGGTNDIVGRNNIHTLYSSVSPAAMIQNGIQVNGGAVRIQNNMVRLGIDVAGFGQTDSSLMQGVLLTGGNARVFFNSVYIGGTSATGLANTFALNRTSTGTDSIYNNIFVNERSGGSGSHFAIGLSSNTNLKSNNNLFYNPGGLSLGLFNNTLQSSVANWRQASGVDGNSNAGNPSFIASTGSVSAVNLHISLTGTTPIEGSGLLISGISTDFDGDVRSANTPTDIGADAGNFTLSDIFAPAISYSSILFDTLSTSLTLNAFAAITDASGVDVTTNQPRLYFKKKTDNNTFLGNTSSDNGWKYVIASNAVSPFSFTINYGIINGGAIAVGDTIEYFVVAQDILGNVGANPAGGFSAASVSSIISAPSTASIYRIKGSPLNGSYNIGSAQTAPNFTTITSAIAALNDVGVSGPVTLNLVDANYSTAETFPMVINEVIGASAVNTVTIKPASSNTTLIAGSAQAIFKLNGADYIIIQGSNNATNTRDLTISNTASSSAAVIWLASTGVNAGARNNTIKNTIIEGGSVSSTSCFGIYSAGQTIANNANGADNDSLIIMNIKVQKTGYGIYAHGISTNKHDYIRVSNSSIGELGSVNSIGNIGIYILQSNDVVIENDSILNINGANAGSSPVGFDGPLGIDFEAGVTNGVVRKNIIDGVVYTGTGGYGGKGIEVRTGIANANIEVSNNMVTNISGDGWSSLDGDAIIGIRVSGATGNVKVYYNTVNLNGTTSGGTTGNRSAAMYAGSAVTALDVRNNIFLNSLFNSSNTSTAYAVASDITNTANITVNYNNYYASGTQGVMGYLAGANVANIATWRTSTTQDQASNSIPVSLVSNNNLHLDATMYGNVGLLGLGLVGYTTDIDEQVRFSSPYMGADEIPSHPLPVTLVSFTAKNNKGDVLLKWVTASEINNKGFFVERSLDGKSFTDIAFVKGAGNTIQVMQYSLTDASAFIKSSAQTLYYRLRQVDLNGKQSISPIAIVQQEELNEGNDLQVYPNPFTNNINIKLHADVASQVALVVFDLSGRPVLNKTFDVVAGSNVLKLAEMEQLNQGVYFIRVIGANSSSTVKIVKTN